MDRRGSRAAFAFATAALLIAMPAQAAMGCWDHQRADAAKVRDLQSRLMVAALRCRAIGMDVTGAYNDFVRRNRPALQAANGLIHAQFETGFGKDADTYYDHFATGLANRYGGDATTAEICDEAAATASDAAAAAGDIARLVAIADRFGSTPDLPGGECTAASAIFPAAAPAAPAAAPAAPAAEPAPPPAKSFGAAMDQALAAVSDAPAEADAPPPRADQMPPRGDAPVRAAQPN